MWTSKAVVFFLVLSVAATDEGNVFDNNAEKPPTSHDIEITNPEESATTPNIKIQEESARTRDTKLQDKSSTTRNTTIPILHEFASASDEKPDKHKTTDESRIPKAAGSKTFDHTAMPRSKINDAIFPSARILGDQILSCGRFLNLTLRIPSKKNLQGCHLKRNAMKELIIVCHCVTLEDGERELETKFSGVVDDEPITHLTLQNVEAELVDESTFAKVSRNISSLLMFDNIVKQITSFNFENIRRMEIALNEIHNISITAFQKLKELEDLSIHGNIFIETKDLDFEMPETLPLKRLEFHNSLKALPLKMLEHSPRLESANFERNEIRTVDNYSFAKNGILKNLSLSKNLITDVSVYAFYFSAAIKWLDLSDNFIERLYPIMIYPLWNLRTLNLGGNKISFVPPKFFLTNKELETVILSRNPLKTLDPNIFSESFYLNDAQISNTLLENVSSRLFRESHWLKKLDLSNNPNLKSLGEELFARFEGLLSLNLSGLNITRSLPSSLMLLTDLRNIDLTNMTIPVDCSTQWLSFWLEDQTNAGASVVANGLIKDNFLPDGQKKPRIQLKECPLEIHYIPPNMTAPIEETDRQIRCVSYADSDVEVTWTVEGHDEDIHKSRSTFVIKDEALSRNGTFCCSARINSSKTTKCVTYSILPKEESVHRSSLAVAGGYEGCTPANDPLCILIGFLDNLNERLISNFSWFYLWQFELIIVLALAYLGYDVHKDRSFPAKKTKKFPNSIPVTEALKAPHYAELMMERNLGRAKLLMVKDEISCTLMKVIDVVKRDFEKAADLPLSDLVVLINKHAAKYEVIKKAQIEKFQKIRKKQDEVLRKIEKEIRRLDCGYGRKNDIKSSLSSSDIAKLYKSMGINIIDLKNFNAAVDLLDRQDYEKYCFDMDYVIHDLFKVDFLDRIYEDAVRNKESTSDEDTEDDSETQPVSQTSHQQAENTGGSASGYNLSDEDCPLTLLIPIVNEPGQ